MCLLFFLLFTTAGIFYFGDYYSNYKKYGKPTVYNTEKGNIPHLYKKTNFERPGVQ